MVKERQYGRELGRGPSSLFTGPPSVWPTPTLERWRLQSSRFSSSVALDERPPHSPPGSGAQFEAEQWENIWWTSSKGEVSEQTAPFFFFFLKSETINKASVGQSPKAEKHVFFSFVRSSRVDCFLQNFPFVFSSPSIGFSFSSFKVRLLVPFLVLLLLFASRASSASSRSYKKGGRDHAKSLF